MSNGDPEPPKVDLASGSENKDTTKDEKKKKDTTKDEKETKETTKDEKEKTYITKEQHAPDADALTMLHKMVFFFCDICI